MLAAAGGEEDDGPHSSAAVMSWLTNYVLPKIRALTRKDVPDNLWRKCPSCEQMLFHRDLAQSLDVCHHCGHHFRIGSEARFKILFDDGLFEKIEAPRCRPTRCVSGIASATPSGCARDRRRSAPGATPW